MRRMLACVLFCLAVPAAGVESWPWELIGKLPHSRDDFVQGLEIRGNELFQGTGIRGRSSLKVFDLPSGRLKRQQALPPRYFGEGITVLGSRIIQLTWRSRKGLVFRRADLRLLDEFPLPGQGWGLTNDGRRLIYSDGSHRLHFISPGDWAITGSLPVTRNGNPLRQINELEWTPGGLLANVWREDFIVRIDATSGAVTHDIDLSGILPRSARRPGTDVLNGIAYDPADHTLWVTGKNWPWLYQIRITAPDWEAMVKKQ